MTLLPRQLVLLLSAAVLAAVMALAPQFAAAHGGHAHEQQAAPESPAVERSAATPDPSVDRLSVPKLSDPCPGGSGGNCCCARPSVVTPNSGKFALVDTGG